MTDETQEDPEAAWEDEGGHTMPEPTQKTL